MIYGSYVSVHEAVNVCMHLLMTVLRVLADCRGDLLITAPIVVLNGVRKDLSDAYQDSPDVSSQTD